MRTFYIITILIIAILSGSACESVKLVHHAEPVLSIDEYVERSVKAVEALDFSTAIESIEKAEQKIKDKPVASEEYTSLLVIKSGIYSYFERLDEAEETLLEATGIPDDIIVRISDSKNPLGEEEHKEIIKEIQKLAEDEDSSGYHIALSLLYNILGDSENLRQEQQIAMDFAKSSQDNTLDVAMGLYRIRGRKIDVHSTLEEHLAQMDTAVTEDQLDLAWLYHYAGWFEEAESITDRYLAELSPDTDSNKAHLSFLYLKMNLETSLGRYESMKSYERKILDIDPTAFDETK